MINLQNLLQTVPSKKAGASNGNASSALVSDGGVSEGLEFEAIMKNQLMGNTTNEEISPELLQTLNTNGAEGVISKGETSEILKQLSKNELAQLNPESLSADKKIAIKKMGVDLNTEVHFSAKDLENLQLVQDQLIAGRKTPSNVQELLNQIKAMNGEEANLETIDPKMLKQLNTLEGENSEEITSPMDYLLKGSKDKSNFDSVGLNQSLNKQQVLKGSLETKDAKDVATNLSADDFIQLRSQKKGSSDVSLLTGNQDQEKLVELMQSNQQNLRAKTMAQNYGREQGILQNNLISKPIDLLNKDEKFKGLGNEEFKSSEFKVNNEMQSIKNDLIFGAAPLAVGAKELVETQVKTAPAFDMMNVKSSNTEEIIKQVSDYIQQSQLAGKDHLDLTVKHNELGQFKINVTKLQGQNAIDMQITAGSKEAHQFFVRHESDLMKSLTQSGIQLSDLKIVSSQSDAGASSQSHSRQFHQSSQDQNSSSKQWASFESQQFGDGRERRKELWEEYRSRLSA